MMISRTEPEKVYVIGAAGYWLKHGTMTAKARQRRIMTAINRQFAKRIDREYQKIEKIEQSSDCFVN